MLKDREGGVFFMKKISGLIYYILLARGGGWVTLEQWHCRRGIRVGVIPL